jgi:hypothetical protein
VADTFVVSTNLSDIVCAQERLHVHQFNQDTVLSPIDPTLNGVPGQETMIQAAAAFAVWNPVGSARRLRLLDMTLNETQGRTQSGTTVAWDMTRITAIDGGIDVPLIPMDTDNTALPSQVKVVRRVNITGTGSSFRKVLDLTQLNATRTLEYMHALRSGPVGVAGGNLCTGMLFSTYDGDVQPITLREGEGIGVLIANNVGRENFPLEMLIWIDVSGETHLVRHVGHPESFGAALAVFNGSGSGVVLNIIRVAVSELMTDQQVATGQPLRFTLETISGIHQNSLGDRLTPVALDSNNDSFPSSVVVAVPCGVIQLSRDNALANGLSRTNEYPIRRLAKVPFGAGVGLGTMALHGLGTSGFINDVISAKYDDGDFVLNPGEGVALFQRDVSGGWGQGWWLRLLMTVEKFGEKYAGQTIGGGTVRGRGVTL